ncbi:MAG: hypothetical protein ABEJ57_08280 [Halobacteriaceae archaeon]
MLCHGVPRLLVEKFSGEPTVDVAGTAVSVSFGDDRVVLSREQARQLRDALDDAVSTRRSFTHTACHHREDGSYVVERRGADSAGHRKVFDSVEALTRLLGRMPEEFTADDLTRSGLTDGRRHLVLWHLVEHPAFDCRLVSRQPLTARRGDGDPVVDMGRLPAD